MENKVTIKAKIGETFKIGDYEFIRFKNAQGGVAVVFRDILFKSEYGPNNNLAESEIPERLKNELVPEIEKLIGAENVLEFETDLTSLDGSKKHGMMKSKISLTTFDFYRENVSIFDRYKINSWWWLATPDSTSEHVNDEWIVCVSPRGLISLGSCNDGINVVRPFLIFSPLIFDSCEE